MEGLVGGLIGIVVVQFSLLWYKIGKVEQRVKDLTNTPGRDKNG